MGNREKQLEKPNVVAIFAGLAFGVIIGAFPIAFPYMPVTIQLGLAGGPLIARFFSVTSDQGFIWSLTNPLRKSHA